MKKYLLGMLLVAGVAYGDHHWAPPQAAFDACAKSKQSDPCSFTGRNSRKLDGTCQIPHAPAAGSGSATASAALVCRPQHHMHGGGSGSAH